MSKPSQAPPSLPCQPPIINSIRPIELEILRPQYGILRGSSDLRGNEPIKHPEQERDRQTISYTHKDYVARRLELFDHLDSDVAEAEGVISRLPQPLQVAFRLKMLSIFAIQLFAALAIVTGFRFHPHANEMAVSFFVNAPLARLAIAFITALAMLVALYFQRNRFPLNWLLLVLFTCAQSVCFVGLGVALHTNIGVVNCAFTFCCVVLMIALSGVYYHESPQDSDDPELLSSLAAGAIAYAIVAVISCVLFLLMGKDFITWDGFCYTLGFQLVLMLWFAYDASAMYDIMSPDEYMHGVIYFYTDLVVLAVAVAAAMAAIAACSVVGEHTGCECHHHQYDWCDCVSDALNACSWNNSSSVGGCDDCDGCGSCGGWCSSSNRSSSSRSNRRYHEDEDDEDGGHTMSRV